METFNARLFMAAVRREAGEQQKDPVTLQELWALLKLKGRPFLEASYQRLLQRLPDPTGLAGYETSSNHFLGRIRILLALLLSPEQSAIPPRLARFLMRLRNISKRQR